MSRKHRYYMRGIGVGILVCALILIISRINTPADISDEEIVSRARALGMVDPGDLSLSAAEDLGSGDTSADQTDSSDNTDSDNANNGDASGDNSSYGDAGTVSGSDTAADQTQDTNDTGTTPDQSEDANDADTSTDKPGDGDAGNDNTSGGAGTVSGNNTAAGQSDITSPVPDGSSYAVLVVEKGNSSDVVARRLESLGVITDSRDFDKYLVDNGYAGRISVGTFQIPYGSDYDYIARVITRSL